MIHEQWLQLKMKFLLGYNLKIIFYWGKINLWWHGMEKYLDRRESNGGMRGVCVCVWGGEGAHFCWMGGGVLPPSSQYGKLCQWSLKVPCWLYLLDTSGKYCKIYTLSESRKVKTRNIKFKLLVVNLFPFIKF